MDQDRFARIQELFAGALALPEGERASYLARACGGDGGLRDEVDSLLAMHGADDAFSEERIVRSREVLEELVDRGVGGSNGGAAPLERIGPYRILRTLGEGGMGVVYEAEQDSPRRRVALKVMRPLLATDERARRFRHEAEVLGRLHHGGIAQVYEAGTFRSGADGRGGQAEQPYFAMELVDGVDLVTHAARASLDTRARLALLAEVCDAVQHAHERGVIHRDLKPDNVLVDEHGRARVLDFGVARAAETSTMLSTLVTEEGQLLGTLTYMSPEQLSGVPEAVTPRSDVYALGALAFELCAGRLPHEVAGLPLTVAIKHVSEREAPLLGAIDQELRGDVETIVQKALEKEPARRYASAAELAADVRRFLASEPIRAHPPSRIYLLRKFARRNRALVGGTLGTLTALLIGTVVAVVFAVRATRQSALAQNRAYRAQLVGAQANLEDGGDPGAVADAVRRTAEYPGKGWEQAWLAAAARTYSHVLESPVACKDTAWRTFTDDGRRFIAPLEDGSLGVWDVATGHRLSAVVEGGPYEGVARSAPAGRVAALTADGHLVVLSLAEDGSAAALEQHALAGAEAGIAVSEDGRRIVVVQPERVLLAEDGKLFAVLEQGTFSTREPRFLPGGEAVVVLRPARAPDSARWIRIDLTTGGVEAWMFSSGVQAFDGTLERMLFHDGIGGVRRASLHETPNGTKLGELRGIRERFLQQVELDRAGRRALTRGGATIRVFGADDLEQQEVFLSPTGGPWGPAGFSQDGEIVVASADGTLYVLDLEAPENPLRLAAAYENDYVYEACFSPDGHRLAYFGRDSRTLFVRDARTGEDVVPPSRQRGVAEFSRDGSRLLLGAPDPFGSSLDLAVGGLEWDGFTGDDWARELAERHKFSYESIGVAHAQEADGAWEAVLSRERDDEPSRSLRIRDRERGRVAVHEVPHSYSVSLRPGSRELALGHRDAVSILDRATGETLAVHEDLWQDYVYGVAYSPDGRRLATADGVGEVAIFDADDVGAGPLLVFLAFETEYAYRVAWSPDGTRLAATGGDGSVVVWDAVRRSGRAREEALRREADERLRPRVDELLARHGDVLGAAIEVRADASLSTDDRSALLRLIAAEARGTSAWSAARQTLAEAKRALDTLRPVLARTLLSTVPADRRGWEWRHLIARCGLEIPASGRIALLPDGVRLVGPGGGGQLKVWDLRRPGAGEELFPDLRLHAVGVDSPPAGPRLVASDEGMVHVLDLERRALVASIDAGDGSPRAVLAPDGKWIVYRGRAEAHAPVQMLWDGETEPRPLDAGSWGTATWTKDGRVFGWGYMGPEARVGFVLLDVATGEVVRDSGFIEEPIHDAGIRPDGGEIAVTLGDGTIRRIDVATRATVAEHPAAPALAARFDSSAVEYSSDGTSIAVTSADAFEVIDTRTGERRVLVDEGGFTGTAPRFGPRGKLLVISGWLRSASFGAFVLDLESRPFLDLDGSSEAAPAGPVQSLAFATEGGRLSARAGGEGEMTWDVWTVERVPLDLLDGAARADDEPDAPQPLRLDGDTVTPSVEAGSPDGTRRAVGLGDGRVLVLESTTRIPLLELDALDAPVTSLAWSPDGDLLAAGTVRGQVRVWDAVSSVARYARRIAPYGVSHFPPESGGK